MSVSQAISTEVAAGAIEAEATGRRRPQLSEGAKAERRLGWMLCAPAVIVMVAVTAFPVGYAIYLSLERYNLELPKATKFIGFSNYAAVLSSPYWWHALVVTLVITVISVTVTLVLGMILATVMHRTLFGRGAIRTAALIPYGIVTVAAAYGWQYAWTPSTGYLSAAFNNSAPLTSEVKAIGVIILAEIWKTTPFMGLLLLAGLSLVPEDLQKAAKALEYARQFVACGPRFNGSAGLLCAQNYLKKQFAHDNLQADTFVASTPAGPQQMTNFIVRFPGKKDGIIVLATHYETNYSLRTTPFVGANDGAATTGLLLEIANHLRGHTLDGYSVWLVFFDGEESVGEQWTNSDSLYGSRHVAAKWQVDGTGKKIKALLLADMIGDRDLNVARVTTATPAIEELVYEAAKKTGNANHFFKHDAAEEDDHLPFVQRGVPAADVIDDDYGPHDAAHPDGWHHTPEDTMDKISAKSLTISGEVFLESIRLLNAR